MINNSQDARLNSKWKTRSHRVQDKWNTLATFKDDKFVLMKFNNLDVSDLDRTQQTDASKKLPRFVDPTTGYLDCVDVVDAFRKEHKSTNERLELTTEGEKETTLQKYYRLKFETEELVQELGFHKDEYNYFNENLCTNIGLKVQSILGKLTKFSVDGCFKQLNDLRTSEINNSQNYIATKLLNKILGNGHGEHFEMISSNGFENFTSEDLRSSRSNNIDRLSKITRLEARLQKLETVVGSEKLIMKRLCDHQNNDGLIEAILSLRKLSKMNLPQVNVIEYKVFFLLPKLRRISIKLKNQNVEAEEDKINKLYATILKAKEESHLLSNIIQRMTTLKYFRYKAEFFDEAINSLGDQYSESSKTLISNELLLNHIETNITKNTSNAVYDLQSLNARIEVFDDQLKNKEAFVQVQR